MTTAISASSIAASASAATAIGQKISLCPLDGAAEGITTEGLKWALRSESLIPGVRDGIDGISNEVVANPVEIRVGRGDLLLCVQREGGAGEILVG